MRRAWKQWMLIAFIWLLGFSLLGGAAVSSAEEAVSLYTPYSSISVTPGESVTYPIDVINNSNSIQSTDISVEGLSKTWKTRLTSGGWAIQKISVKPKDSQSVSLQVDVPLDAAKGAYHFEVMGSGITPLSLSLNVTEEGTFKTEFTTDQPNMQGPAKSTFSYSATLKNHTAEKQLYALSAEAPRGWDVQFKVDGKQVTSVNVDPNGSKDVGIDIVVPDKIKAGTYKIPVKASTNSTSAKTELEAAITGSYAMKLSTPNGLLSTDVTAGSERKVQLQITNTGTADLKDIQLKADAPVNWSVDFEPKTISGLAAGKDTQVTATIKADDKAIAGDYVVNMTASTPESSSDASFRVAVKTSLLWGWLGIIVILAVIGGMYYVFRTYGRR